MKTLNDIKGLCDHYHERFVHGSADTKADAYCEFMREIEPLLIDLCGEAGGDADYIEHLDMGAVAAYCFDEPSEDAPITPVKEHGTYHTVRGGVVG